MNKNPGFIPPCPLFSGHIVYQVGQQVTKFGQLLFYSKQFILIKVAHMIAYLWGLFIKGPLIWGCFITFSKIILEIMHRWENLSSKIRTFLIFLWSNASKRNFRYSCCTCYSWIIAVDFPLLTLTILKLNSWNAAQFL